MVEEFESDGLWWLPGKEDVKVPGKFIYNLEQELVLEINDTFYNFANLDLLSWQPFSILSYKTEAKIILGILTDGKPITLYDCFGMTTRRGIDNPVHLIGFKPNLALIGVHFESEEDFKQIKLLQARLSYLEVWVGRSGLTGNFDRDEEEIRITYKKPAKIKICNINNCELSIDFSRVIPVPNASWYFDNKFKAKIEQETFLQIENPQLETLENCTKILIEFCQFLSFAVKRPVQILSLLGKVDAKNPENYIKEIVIQILGSWKINKKYSEMPKINHLTDMMFNYGEVENELKDIFEKWLGFKEDLKIVRELLLVNIYTPQLYLEYKFINIIQALEAYHAKSNKYHGKYLSEPSFKNGIKKTLKDLIDNYPSQNEAQELGISDEFKEVLKGKLNFFNDYTLKSRLFDIIEKISPLLPHQFIGDLEERKKFMRNAANIRDALTHHSNKKRKKLPNTFDFSDLTLKLTLLLQTCLLQELGLSEEKIKKIMEKRMWHKGYIRQINSGQ